MKSKYVTEYEMYYLKDLLVKRISELFKEDILYTNMTHKDALEIIEIIEVLNKIEND